MTSSQQKPCALLTQVERAYLSAGNDPGSNPGQASISNMAWRYNFVTSQHILTFCQMDSMVIFTYSLTYFFITLCLSLGITRTRISPIFEIFATYCNKIVISKSTNPSLKNRDGQIYYTIFIYFNILKYILDTHSRHNKGGG